MTEHITPLFIAEASLADLSEEGLESLNPFERSRSYRFEGFRQNPLQNSQRKAHRSRQSNQPCALSDLDWRTNYDPPDRSDDCVVRSPAPNPMRCF